MNNVAAPLSMSDHIRVLNDNFRSTFVGGQVVIDARGRGLTTNTKPLQI